MEDRLKTLIVAISIISAVLFCLIAIGSCNSASRQKAARDKEMATRLDLEEKMGKFSHEKTKLEDKIKALEKESEEENAAHQALKKALVQEQLVNQSIKEELQKVTKLKEALEEDLKEALVANKAAKSKK